jgi:hypothetical protein
MRRTGKKQSRIAEYRMCFVSAFHWYLIRDTSKHHVFSYKNRQESDGGQ